MYTTQDNLQFKNLEKQTKIAYWQVYFKQTKKNSSHNKYILCTLTSNLLQKAIYNINNYKWEHFARYC